MKQGLVSVIISTYNRLHFLKEAIESVKTQTLQEWELIIVDDASSDGTWDWLQSIQNTQIRLLRMNQNSERSVARNQGLSAAFGEFVMFLDDDDRLRPDALERLVQPLKQHPHVVATVGARWKFREGVYATKISHPRIPFKKIIWPELLAGWSSVSGQNLFRAAVVKQVGGFPLDCIPCEDRYLWLQVAHLGPVVLIPAIALDYRDHGQTRPKNIEHLRETVFQDFIQQLSISEQAQAQRIRASTQNLQTADQKYRQADYKAAFVHYWAACRTAPNLAMSPLTAAPMLRGLAKSLLRCLPGV